jgi:hypothetical protein
MKNLIKLIGLEIRTGDKFSRHQANVPIKCSIIADTSVDHRTQQWVWELSIFRRAVV